MIAILGKIKYYTAAIAVAGLLFIVMSVITLIKVSNPPVDFYSLAPQDIKGSMHISGDIDFVMDCVTSKVEETRLLGVIKTSEKEEARTYGVPFMYQDDKGMVYIDAVMGMSANNSLDYGKIDRIIDASWKWWDDTTGTVPYPTESFKVDGLTRKMNKQEKELYIEYLVYCGYSESEANQMLVPYVVSNVSKSRNVSSIIIGAVLLLVGGIITALGFIFAKEY